MMRGGHREADKPTVVERGHDERDVGAVARPGIGVVVHDHVAGANLVAAFRHLAKHSLHVAGDGTGLQRGGLGRLREPLTGRIHQAGSEVLGFADDGRVRHSHELVAHLRRDVLERALDDARGDRVHPAVRAFGEAVATTVSGAALAVIHGRGVVHGESSMVGIRSPDAFPRTAMPRGSTAVESLLRSRPSSPASRLLVATTFTASPRWR